MSHEPRGVGVNAETDDYAARYDRMVDGRSRPFAVKTVIALLLLLALIALGGSLL